MRNGVFDAAPTLSNNTYGGLDTRISACLSINSSPDNDVRLIAIEDDGSLSSTTSEPGFYVQDDLAITTFLDSASCQAAEDCLRFCPRACLRLGIVSVSQDLTTRGFKMVITDGSKSAHVLRGNIWFDELQNHLSAQVPLALPAPTASGAYQVSFLDGNDQPAWPGYASLSLERQPTCSGALTDSSQIEFVKPPPDGRCDDLFHRDDYPQAIHGWQVRHYNDTDFSSFGGKLVS